MTAVSTARASFDTIEGVDDRLRRRVRELREIEAKDGDTQIVRRSIDRLLDQRNAIARKTAGK